MCIISFFFFDYVCLISFLAIENWGKFNSEILFYDVSPFNVAVQSLKLISYGQFRLKKQMLRKLLSPQIKIYNGPLWKLLFIIIKLRGVLVC